MTIYAIDGRKPDGTWFRLATFPEGTTREEAHRLNDNFFVGDRCVVEAEPAEAKDDPATVAYAAECMAIDGYLAELSTAAENHFDRFATAGTVSWTAVSSLQRLREKLRDAADCYLGRGEYAS